MGIVFFWHGLPWFFFSSSSLLHKASLPWPLLPCPFLSFCPSDSGLINRRVQLCRSPCLLLICWLSRGFLVHTSFFLPVGHSLSSPSSWDWTEHLEAKWADATFLCSLTSVPPQRYCLPDFSWSAFSPASRMCGCSLQASHGHRFHRVFCLGYVFFLSRRLLACGEWESSSSVIPPHLTCLLVCLLSDFQNSGFCSMGEIASVCTFQVLISTSFTYRFYNTWHRPLCSLLSIYTGSPSVAGVLSLFLPQSLCHPQLWNNLPQTIGTAHIPSAPQLIRMFPPVRSSSAPFHGAVLILHQALFTRSGALIPEGIS